MDMNCLGFMLWQVGVQKEGGILGECWWVILSEWREETRPFICLSDQPVKRGRMGGAHALQPSARRFLGEVTGKREWEWRFGL